MSSRIQNNKRNNVNPNRSKAVWQRNFEEFTGPGIHHASGMMRVTNGEARNILKQLSQFEWQAPVYQGEGRHAAYRICNAKGTPSTALFHGNDIAGFYAGSYLWIADGHRGRGLSTPLILCAAEQRGGGVMPEGVVVQGYTPTGLAAHRSAHRHAVLSALAKGLPVPTEVLKEMQLDDHQLSGSESPAATQTEDDTCSHNAG